jgi:hypothetical protein
MHHCSEGNDTPDDLDEVKDCAEVEALCDEETTDNVNFESHRCSGMSCSSRDERCVQHVAACGATQQLYILLYRLASTCVIFNYM